MGRARSSVSEAELRCAEKGLVIRVRDDGLGRRLGLAQHLRGDVAGGDLAQREHRRLVVLEREGGLRAVGEPPGALRREQHQLEEVLDVVQAVFYGDSGHWDARVSTPCTGCTGPLTISEKCLSGPVGEARRACGARAL